ncbi:MAG: aldo/keto reductase [Arhodomonas sp.]|nr:aldo/keto reductase [Arhodomonas sp.]
MIFCVPAGRRVFKQVMDLKERGVVERVGVSVYSPEELEAVQRHFPLDLVQLPFNLIDRRFATTGWLERLKNKEIEVHARSIYLQGLLLMSPRERPAYFKRWSELFERFDRWLNETGLERLEAALGFSLAEPAIDRVVIGVQTESELQAALRACAHSAGVVPSDLAEFG